MAREMCWLLLLVAPGLAAAFLHSMNAPVLRRSPPTCSTALGYMLPTGAPAPSKRGRLTCHTSLGYMLPFGPAGRKSSYNAGPPSAPPAALSASSERNFDPAVHPDAYDRVLKSIWEKGSNQIDYIFENNRRWVKETLKKDPDNFNRVRDGQQPKFLYIGCSDSRVPAETMMGLGLGELFVTRNVANLCLNTDYSLLSVLMYSVEVLQVTDIIVCGHYGCGGVKAAMQNKDHGLLEHWLHNIRDVQRLHQAELLSIPNEQERHDRLVELNVQETCMNLFANPIVQKKQAQDSQPRIHGWVYDIGSGYLKDLQIDFRPEVRRYKDIYRVYDFPDPAGANGNMTPRRTVQPAPVAAPQQPAGPVAPATA